ncbi:MAG: undecaprenyl/decaprenyl-phosphate alpha-N-acetylglucosaminyl 1-phosphate transferase [Treponema sp.]|jgi:UDP-GlcNAc:undecaprenyl-phosphate GlcNAc-1-phosphate transferase|nr:undecaprenyl/decaprenyl-phosphate alpha-N-acetylglucosaminyl 1-phosphate transferase [Treponema sp.]
MVFFVILSFLLSVFFIAVVIRFCDKYQLFDKVNKRKIHTGNIARLGGAGFIPAFLIAALIYTFTSEPSFIVHILPIVFSGLLIFIFGLLDDIFDLRARLKLLIQVIAAAILIFSGYQFKQICFIKLAVPFQYILTFFWILGMINAFNLIDGIDGLCGGISLLSICSLGIIYYRSARPIAVICFILSAAITGFLVFNYPPAKIFMGDGGSQFLGFMIAALPLYKSTTNFEYNKFLLMCVIVSIPMIDTFAAIWRRTREHRSLLSSDSAHIHHKLINIGFTRKQVLFLLISVQALLCLTAGLAMYLQEFKGAVLLFVALLFIMAFFGFIHFTNRAVNRERRGKLAENPEKEK